MLKSVSFHSMLLIASEEKDHCYLLWTESPSNIPSRIVLTDINKFLWSSGSVNNWQFSHYSQVSTRDFRRRCVHVRTSYGLPWLPWRTSNLKPVFPLQKGVWSRQQFIGHVLPLFWCLARSVLRPIWMRSHGASAVMVRSWEWQPFL